MDFRKKLEVIDDNISFKEYLERASFPDGTYINVNLLDNCKRVDRKGLDYAVQHLESEQETPIVMYSFEAPHNLFLDRRFMKTMCSKNSYFIRLPFGKSEIEKIRNSPTFDNEALKIASNYLKEISLVPMLKHSHPRDPSEVIKRARKELSFCGKDEEIMDFLDSFGEKREGKNLGKIPGVFVDVEGTLLIGDKINGNIVKDIIQYSEEYPITMWTGGDTKELVKKLGPKLESICSNYKSTLYLRTPILSKQIFRNSEPEIVIDDLSQGDFEKEYKMNPQTYIQIKNSK